MNTSSEDDIKVMLEALDLLWKHMLGCSTLSWPCGFPALCSGPTSQPATLKDKHTLRARKLIFDTSRCTTQEKRQAH